MLSLIKNTDLNQRTAINGNVDISNYKHIIREIQLFVIEPSIGTALYKKIEDDFKNNTLTDNYKKLYDDYLVSLICYEVACEFILLHNFSIGNGGIFKHNPENGSAVDKVEVDYFANKYRQKANEIKDLMYKFLCVVNLPEWKDPQSEKYDIKPYNKKCCNGWII